MNFKEAVEHARDGEFVAREKRHYAICSINGISLHIAEWVEEYVEVFKRPYCDDYHSLDEWDAGYSPWIDDVLADDWELIDWEWETDGIAPFVNCTRVEYVAKFNVSEEEDKELIKEWSKKNDKDVEEFETRMQE